MTHALFPRAACAAAAVTQNTAVPTLPLITGGVQGNADAPRMIVAPGGYQWWYFEAYDPVADVRVLAILFDGNPFHPQYLRRYAWYRRAPTRFIPPVPVEFPGILVRVYEKGQIVHRVMRGDRVGGCRWTDASVRVGDDGFTRLSDGGMHLSIRGSLDLTWRPKVTTDASRQVQELAHGVSVAEPHGWIVSNPLCAVEGELTLRHRRERFSGLGYQDHNYGAEPVHLAARRWFWACAWLDGRAHVVAEVVPTRGPSQGVRLIGSDAPGSATWSARTAWRLPYPTMVDFGEHLRLDEPRVVESTPVAVQLRYRAQVGALTTTALAHVVEPGRAGWPVIGRIVEHLIETPGG